MSREAATIFVGVDEAGYGPILGPLVASAAVFEVPPRLAECSLWDVLARSIHRDRSSRDPRLPILDSKKLYHRKEGLARLERPVLGVLTAWRGPPATLRGLLERVCPEVVGQLDGYPWYRQADPALPLSADAGGVRIAAALLRRDLAARSVGLGGLFAEVLPEGHYNRLVDRTRNKAVVLAGLVLRLIDRVARAYPRHALRVFVDKQGARSHYGGLLMRAFDGRRLRVLHERDDESAYELVAGPSRWRIQFTQSGEAHQMPVALASMLSKYLREVLMACFNAYWADRVPGVKATAGYYQDGLRFLKDIQPHLRRLGIERDQLARQR